MAFGKNEAVPVRPFGIFCVASQEMEIKQDEERILRLEKALGEMHAVADSAGDGRPTGQEGQP